MKVPVKYLDIVIIRSCQLDCAGCVTFSDHHKVKSHSKLDELLPSLEFWANQLDPQEVFLFGGEPLMHPQFKQWAEAVYNLFVKGTNKELKVQTNGMRLVSIPNEELEYYLHDLKIRFVVTQHSQDPQYVKNVKKGLDKLDRILGFIKVEGKDTSIYYNSEKAWYSTSYSSDLPWVQHYRGFGPTLKPSWPWHSHHHITNHEVCHIKDYVEFYEGNLYKCPPMAVLKQTLEQYNLTKDTEWAPWVDYPSLSVNATEQEIADWFVKRNGAELYCNLCFGDDSPKPQIHKIKIHTDK